MRHEFINEQAFNLFNVIHSNIDEDDVAFIQETKQVYMYKNGQWQLLKIKAADSNVQLTLYDINKQIMEQVPELKQKEKNDAHKIINDFAAMTKQRHFMMLCLEERYFTIFEQAKLYDFGSLGSAVFACIDNIGQVKSVSYNNAQAVEIWITNTTGSTNCYLLFGYDDGMVYFA